MDGRRTRGMGRPLTLARSSSSVCRSIIVARGRCRRRPQSRARPGWHHAAWGAARHDGCVSEEIEGYENNLELELFKEYRDVIGLFKFVVETERRFYLCNHVDVQARPVGGDVFFELTLTDAWVWDIYRSSRFVRSVRVITYKDVNVEELSKPELDIP